MITGIGSDIIQIPRIEQALLRFGDKFLLRILSKQEMQDLHARFPQGTPLRQVAGFVAKRFAAKEACAKALGTGIRGGLRFVDMEIVNDAKGRPSLTLHRKAAELAGGARILVSLSDDYPTALAMVVVEKTS